MPPVDGGSSSTGTSPQLWHRNAGGSKTPQGNFSAGPQGRLNFLDRIKGKKHASTTQLESQDISGRNEDIPPAPLATPENIELGVEYMTVKVGLECLWRDRKTCGKLSF